MPTRPTPADSFDVIVIGSGMGGLAAASLLTQLAGKRVLLLERHFKLGGFTHAFTRHGYRWDVGLHYVGQMHPGTEPRRLFDLVTGNGVDWTPLPNLLERFLYPGVNFPVPADRRAYQDALVAAFPHEADAIARYFRDIAQATGWLQRHVAGKLMPAPVQSLLARPGRDHALQTTQQVLDRTFRDPALKSLLVSQWGDYGQPPSRSAFAIHALIVEHYLDGAFYPTGGAGTIAQSIQPIVEGAGGACLVNHEVSEILLDEGRAVGVRVRAQGTRPERCFHAPIIISDAGAYITYQQLLPAQLHLPQQRELAALPAPLSAVSVYLGLQDSPARIGLSGENLWVYAHPDHEQVYARRNRLLEGEATFAFVSFGSMHDPQAPAHSAQIISRADHAEFVRWQEQPWLQRDETYADLKARMAQSLVNLVEQHYPGFGDLIDYSEVSTPLTVAHFTGHPQGAIYSVPVTPARYLGSVGDIKTPLAGLYLTGADVVSPGIVGALMGGVLTAARLLGPRGFPQIRSAARRR